MQINHLTITVQSCFKPQAIHLELACIRNWENIIHKSVRVEIFAFFYLPDCFISHIVSFLA